MLFPAPDMGSLQAISPLDGRYSNKISPLVDYFSELALIKRRVLVEIEYLIQLSEDGVIEKIDSKTKKELRNIVENFDLNEGKLVKDIEGNIRHDVKSVEYYLRHKFADLNFSYLNPFIHIGLTSEDVNSVAYRLMLKEVLGNVIIPKLELVSGELGKFIAKNKRVPMLARTHGQAALPTLLGKEFAVFVSRLKIQIEQLKRIRLRAKFGGAVGNMSALKFAFPNYDWMQFGQNFLSKFKLDRALPTTQIAPGDDLAEVFHVMMRINSILIDLDQDIWRYISDGWFVQKGKKGFVGSSTMPQKINPIEFENSEGNLQLANGMFHFLSGKLPISRLQRDLSDSTVLRNVGVGFGHSLIGYLSFIQGIKVLGIDKQKIKQALFSDWSILGEAAQVLLRNTGEQDAYEQVAELLRGIKVGEKEWKKLVSKLKLNKRDMQKLLKLTPANYIGLSQVMADHRR
ncbi:adenylosuccinate lyase [Candidatus Roizmanbacteria bacterium CG22_combo_CG10-13_8_21_14_all_38_20]|uniref:Adenylosuccinate lyase n=1 Tax=Candidatus Roizmanbacteria bacterium CG22_combo_CG10-13_8_21_14_all_38_20 TaxID=1974862 RepID=A0A2H0BW09_9BACT|nr:MAG: adenylosuccinate lyase [Candidatus Roizmanbacteria bacterium CG22_combo_CG10-13_8_21_14_all_38_20]PJC32160.1 MAG: adenylosuccinate lyase [Candidatus Roizmanbacteria bacterium CG_4_9_14_0_2_um_filter_38_17]